MIRLEITCAMALSLAFVAMPGRAETGLMALQPLSFGAIVSGASGGTVTVSDAGIRSTSGSIFQSTSSLFAPAVFQLSLPAGTSNFSITLPSDNTVSLTVDGASMPLRSFTYSRSPDGTMIRVGATLVVGSNQLPGSYQGSFNVTVSYN